MMRPGHTMHLLRGQDSDAVTHSADDLAGTKAPKRKRAKVIKHKINLTKKTDLPWFLRPETYERDSGCDLSEAVRLFKPEELEITCDNIDKLELGESLGEGFWREVYKASWKGRDVAVKVVKEDLLDRNDIIPRHVEEAAVIFPIRNEPNIVGLVGWCNTTVVVDYVPTPLDEFIYDLDNEVTVERALEIARDAARGLQQLHAAAGGPFAHTDIQTRQFLIDANGTVLLNDFNRVKYTGQRLHSGSVEGHEKCMFKTAVAKGKWRSPEEYENRDLDEKLDVYSISLVLWSLRSRVKPFPNYTKPQVYKKVPKGERPPVDAMKDYPKAMQQLIVRAWNNDPAKRPSSAELAQKIDEILTKYKNKKGT
ncbi:TPA: hypothetical protein N0F65_005537 [Lagenidium giganteum]|uniref:Protein kinase domain-containing protein n=1 Tax=Lagenidium giganteum TaxID=4803 RepID=A0AAV2YRK4_9STRA|nr:TPA: hypothetical protein N0F65_005537 [Lagenidium giganteum]